MGLESDPGTSMEVGCDQRVTIPSDRADDKITGQMNLLVEVPEEQMAGQLRLTRLSRRRRANRKDLRLPRFHITYRIMLRGDALEKQRVVPGTLGAVMAGTRLGHKRCIFFREWRGDEFQENVVLDPFAQMANGEQDALRLAAARIALLPASGQRFLLLL